jgi:hypothetical protein
MRIALKDINEVQGELGCTEPVRLFLVFGIFFLEWRFIEFEGGLRIVLFYLISASDTEYD